MEWAVDGDGDEGDVKDESAAYLEFLNEEVGYDDLQSSLRIPLTKGRLRLKSSEVWVTMMMTSSKKRACWKRHWTRWNHMDYSRTP